MLGTNIREYRKKQKLTMKELAERTGLSIGYISQVERGETEPSLSSLRKIAGEFDVPVYVLLDDHKNDSSLTIRREERMTAHVRKNSVEYEFLTEFFTQSADDKSHTRTTFQRFGNTHRPPFRGDASGRQRNA